MIAIHKSEINFEKIVFVKTSFSAKSKFPSIIFIFSSLSGFKIISCHCSYSFSTFHVITGTLLFADAGKQFVMPSDVPSSNTFFWLIKIHHSKKQLCIFFWL